ncbi:DUF1127 domain-containing protein [Paracoccus benzoatiresistens]|uniref:DUF1127 domain-containing protein n=1 Tax=Paracoccus benzoatiresistens TaxID=2997341 RepID=A0ABT4JDF8_9RHOB|nr:DUF1127 domain-containing protein [Paracoccus sp. EF6]MCZ0964403.1 DUF1127 domain-containing protein [Paracoccus sp. EF6]
MSPNPIQLDPFFARIPFLSRGTASILSPFQEWVRNAARLAIKRRTIRLLESLDDRMLDDIGLSRSQISRVVDDLIADDPRPAEVLQSGRRALSQQRESHEAVPRTALAAPARPLSIAPVRPRS